MSDKYSMLGVCMTGDNLIYVAGGIVRKLGSHGWNNENRVSILPGGVSADVNALNVATRNWTSIERMLRPRCQFSLVTVDELVQQELH
jgi:anthranilate/para-aminobenzoate synthase component II